MNHTIQSILFLKKCPARTLTKFSWCIRGKVDGYDVIPNLHPIRMTTCQFFHNSACEYSLLSTGLNGRSTSSIRLNSILLKLDSGHCILQLSFHPKFSEVAWMESLWDVQALHPLRKTINFYNHSAFKPINRAFLCVRIYNSGWRYKICRKNKRVNAMVL